jgi:hypothetical protein
MRLSEKDARKDRKSRPEQPPHAVLDAWPLPAQAAVPEADEPLDRSAEGDDEPITEKLPATTPAPPDSDRD